MEIMMLIFGAISFFIAIGIALIKKLSSTKIIIISIIAFVTPFPIGFISMTVGMMGAHQIGVLIALVGFSVPIILASIFSTENDHLIQNIEDN